MARLQLQKTEEALNDAAPALCEGDPGGCAWD